MEFFAYKITDRFGRISFCNGRTMTKEEKQAEGRVEAVGPFATRDEALDAQLALEGKPTWAEMERTYAKR